MAFAFDYVGFNLPSLICLKYITIQILFLYFYSYLTALSLLRLWVSGGGIPNELERIWKEMVMA
jgi:hypothetical protein